MINDDKSKRAQGRSTSLDTILSAQVERVEVAGFYCSFSGERRLARDEGPGRVSGGQLRARAATVRCEFECMCDKEKWWKWVEEELSGLYMLKPYAGG